MANLHKTFVEFNDNVKLNSTKKEQLKKSRTSVRDDIRKYFESKDNHTVSFKGQGSYMMNTVIEPISGEFDIDDGVYIFGTEENKPTAKTAHNWIFNAVKDRTTSDPLDKNTCVRVIYKNSYHVDLPIYYVVDRSKDQFTYLDEPPILAHLNKGWIESDPYAFKKWFDKESQGKPQLKRVVRYLKAWSDKKQNDNNQLKFPSGMIFTILASNNFNANDRDDISLLETLKAIQRKIDNTRFMTSYSCYRPTTNTTENLLDKYSSSTTKNNFLDALNNLIKSGEQAIEVESNKDACAKWQKHLGDRFPCSNVVDNNESKSLAKQFSSVESIFIDNRSA